VKECLISLVPHISNNAMNKRRRRKILPEDFHIALSYTVIKRQLIKRLLFEQIFGSTYANICNRNNIHRTSPLSKTCFKSLTML